jgi:hypothetical protein
MSELVAILGLVFLFVVFGMLRFADRSGATSGCHGCSQAPAGPQCASCEVTDSDRPQA